MMRPGVLSRPENIAILLAIFCDGGSAILSSPGRVGERRETAVRRPQAKDRWPPRRLRAGVAAATAHPRAGFRGPALDRADRDTAAPDSAAPGSAGPDRMDSPAAGGPVGGRARSMVAAAEAQTGPPKG